MRCIVAWMIHLWGGVNFVGLLFGRSFLNPAGGTKVAASKGVVWLVFAATLLSGCGPTIGFTSEDLEAMRARTGALLSLCTRDRQAMPLSEIVEVLRLDEDLYINYHQHSVQIVQLSKIDAVPIGDHWIVGARVQATDLVTVGHDWQDAMWLVENASAPNPEVWSVDSGAALFSRAPLHAYQVLARDSSWYEASLPSVPNRSWDEAFEAARLCLWTGMSASPPVVPSAPTEPLDLGDT